MSIALDTVKDTYNKIGDHFNRTRALVWPDTRLICKMLEKGDKVLDLGCGNGRLLTGIKTKVEYLGIDFSKVLLTHARLLHPTKTFLLDDITQDSVWKELQLFDAIFCVAVIHHIAKREKQCYILEQARKHLTKKGFLYITCWNFLRKGLWGTHFSKESLLLKTMNWRFLSEPYDRKVNRFYVTFDKRYLKNLLHDAGFTSIDVYYADKEGKRTNFLKGNNLCALARK